jgi:hypothetical protein
MADIPTLDVVALVRRRYREGATVKTIMAETGIGSVGLLYRCVAGDFPDGSGVAPEPIPRRQAAVGVRDRRGSRAALVARMWRTAERQVEEIEHRLKAAGIELAERESNARTLAVVAKTLRELAAFDESRTARGKEEPKDNDDNAGPRNIDDLRRDLAQKLAAFVAGRTNPVSGDAG